MCDQCDQIVTDQGTFRKIDMVRAQQFVTDVLVEMDFMLLPDGSLELPAGILAGPSKQELNDALNQQAVGLMVLGDDGKLYLVEQLV